MQVDGNQSGTGVVEGSNISFQDQKSRAIADALAPMNVAIGSMILNAAFQGKKMLDRGRDKNQ
jgi:hypothetical protein